MELLGGGNAGERLPFGGLFLRSGGALAVRRELTIAAVAANPWSAYGWHFEPDKFIAALREVIDLPVVNVKED